MKFSRRDLLYASGLAGAGLLLPRTIIRGEQATPETILEPVRKFERTSTVALVQGNERRKNAYDALTAIDHEISPLLKRKKSVLIKPNLLTPQVPLADTNADALRGILDYLAPRFKGPVVIAEASARDTLEGYEVLDYKRLVSEYPSAQLSFVDFSREQRYETLPILDFDIHVMPVRLAARLFDPDAFIICSAVTKAHNYVVATLSVKNMVLGAPPHSLQGETPRWSDKRKFHAGVRGMHYNMFLAAQKMQPYWGVALIDGFEGMEGDGPARGTAVPHRIAIASTDFIAADRVALEAMGVNPDWVGYLRYCGQNGLGQYDLAKINTLGPPVASVRRSYQLSPNIDPQLQWMGPMKELQANPRF